MLHERILIAEDDFAIATNVFTFLERKGYEVEAVYSGQAAVHRCSIERFDLVLLDIGLPGFDGLGVLQRLRSELRVAHSGAGGVGAQRPERQARRVRARR